MFCDLCPDDKVLSLCVFCEFFVRAFVLGVLCLQSEGATNFWGFGFCGVEASLPSDAVKRCVTVRTTSHSIQDCAGGMHSGTVFIYLISALCLIYEPYDGATSVHPLCIPVQRPFLRCGRALLSEHVLARGSRCQVLW